MKRFLVWIILFFTLFGCKNSNNDMDYALAIRQQLLKSDGCKFTARISADYRDEMYTFTLQCTADSNGKVEFIVNEPESIQNISGFMDSKSGNLTFDDKVLAFPHLSDNLITPVSAPWFFIRTLRSGYMASYSNSGEYFKLTADDSYADNSLQLDIFFKDNLPVHADFMWQGSRILSMEITDFVYL